MNKIMKEMIYSRPLSQTLQGLAVGGFSRMVGEGPVMIIPVMYGVSKYVLNRHREMFHSEDMHYPFEKHSALKKTAWYALGVGLSHADQLYLAAQSIIDRM
jgi:hypothetical protein